MDGKIQELLESVQGTPDFGYVDFHSINDTNELGDNALHCVCVWGDFEAVRLLVENGINLNQRGELGFTPLNVAVEFGHHEIAEYLIAHGANSDALRAEPEFDRERQTLHVRRLAEHIKMLQCKLAAGRALAV